MIPINYNREMFGNNLIGKKPIDGYELPHPFDRPGQVAAYSHIMQSDKPYSIIKLPTGIGKTAIAAMMSRYVPVMAVTRKKSLQIANYDQIYEFEPVYGKGSYECGHDAMFNTDTCAYPYAKESLSTGESKNEIFNRVCKNHCPYYEALYRAENSGRVSLNYAKLFTDRKQKFNDPKVIFFDEGHELPDITIGYAGVEVRWDNKFVDMEPIVIKDNPTIGIEMLKKIYQKVVLSEPYPKNASEEDSPKFKKLKKDWDRLKTKLGNALSNVETDTDDENLWFYYGDKDKFQVKPKSARFHFKKILCYRKAKYVIMSATIDEKIAIELGLEPEEYDYIEIDNPYPPLMRPIIDLGCPRMSNKSTMVDRSVQASKIAEYIKQYPDQSAVVLTTAKDRGANNAIDIADRLRNYGLETFVPPLYESTDGQIIAWEKARKPGLVCVSWSFWEGVNLDSDGIIILSKVPYPSLGDPFEVARMKYDMKEWRRRTVVIFVQGAGRNRRGKKEHYYPRNTQKVVIADGNWTRLGKSLPQDFIDCIVEY